MKIMRRDIDVKSLFLSGCGVEEVLGKVLGIVKFLKH